MKQLERSSTPVPQEVARLWSCTTFDNHFKLILLKNEREETWRNISDISESRRVDTSTIPFIALKMAIEIVDFPIKNGDFPLLCLHVQ